MTVETTATGTSAIDRARIAELTEREMAKLAAAHAGLQGSATSAL